ncbi:hypothetical protein CBS101457_005839 [Exobasidium rhododendri]|nr:hypothetical protein CBS101457_005839 [Exobasidium rhododendri]
MVIRSAPSLPPSAWIKSIDATYTIFESEKLREQYGHLSEQVQKAVRLCEEVVQEFGIDQCALSFNGGKDCTVLIHILAAVYRRLSKSPQSSSSSCKLEDILPSIPSLYITCTSPFPEVEEFVSDSIHSYNLNIVRLGGDMKEVLEKYLEGEGEEIVPGANGELSRAMKKTRKTKAMFLGTRRTDPHGANLKHRDHTDEGWPDVERIQPILDWSYQDVWDFLRCPVFAVQGDQKSQPYDEKKWGKPYGIPYCVLYDEGYTSLGSTFNTFPNPVLDTRKGEPVSEADKVKGRWKPAYMLQDESLERAGRVRKSS